jgi:DNA adenine methylase
MPRQRRATSNVTPSTPEEKRPIARPFIKWAGGKRQLLTQLFQHFPKQIGTYYEPFLGGGAVFFALSQERGFQRAVINDFNRELMDCYRVIRDFPEDLMKQLDRYSYDRRFFDRVKAQKPDKLQPVQRAARMIYLNKNGFNGLYRVNRKGEFNVPFGQFAKAPANYDRNNILACSAALSSFVDIQSMDFEASVSRAVEGDLVYFDPPYVPATPTSSFTSYTSTGFGLKEQERLAKLVRDLADRGVHVVASNSDTPIVRKLYEGCRLTRVEARRAINSRGDKRGPVGELIIVD